MAPRVRTLKQRFLLHVDQHGPIIRAELGRCWTWTRSLDISGYGRIRRGGRRGKTEKAHRVAWFFEHGSIPDLLVLHKCDNRACVRPDHLFLGTKKDNAQDAVRKGRWLTGEKNPRAKLSDADVEKIQRQLLAGVRQRDIAAKFGVSQKLINFINLGHRTTGPVNPRKFVLSPDLVRVLKQRYAAGGVSHARLARELGVSKSAISHALEGKTWA